ncbi:MAG: NAD(P)/FAD-dependent oxidoreductase [Prochloraceae cyanobacterium]
MKTYDWIVIGAGITGSALAYELAKIGFKVAIVEKDSLAENATSNSYGGIAYWSATDSLTRQLAEEGIAAQRQLPRELAAETEFQEIDLFLTINADRDPETILANYHDRFAIGPTLLSVSQACQIEPLLNPNAISGVLRLPHASVHPDKLTLAYQKAFSRLGGEIIYDRVVKLLQEREKIAGVKTLKSNYYAANTVVCAGGLSRSILASVGVKVPVYFTYAQLIKTLPVDFPLSALIMPAVQKRFDLEDRATSSDLDRFWQESETQSLSPILDPGVVQFKDNSLCIGQISQIITNPTATIDSVAGEAKIRQGIATILPSLEKIPGTWHSCLVAFTNNSIATVGSIENLEGIYVFSGFTSTFLFAPPLAKRFVNWVTLKEDTIIPQLSFS